MKNSSIKYSIIQILSYFDVFDFPLSKEEIINYSKFESEEVSCQLEIFVQEELVYLLDGYYTLKNNPQLIQNRISGVWRAKSFAKKAMKRANFIGKFPYVRGVFISGSFSKGIVPENGDIDYFIISKHNRLWISRTILIIYKKIFLFNSRKFFCLNYFISEKELEINQKNLFTATEIFTLIPMVNSEIHQHFLEKNKWVEEIYDFKKIKKFTLLPFQLGIFQKLVEGFCKGKLGEKLDIYLMKKTFKRWEKKFPDMPKYDFDIAFQTNRNVSKHHPSNYQKSVLQSFENKMKQILIS